MRSILFSLMSALCLLIVMQCNNANRESSLKELIDWHLARKKSMRVQDVYKMLYQSAFGPRHILNDPEEADRYLRKEYQSVDASFDEPLLEPISIDGTVVRVNLRPYKARGGRVDLLFDAVKLSAERMQGQPDDLLVCWQKFVRLVKKGHYSFDLQEARKFEAQIREIGPSPVHHSSEYTDANRPAYRVVLADVFEEITGMKP